MVNVWVDHLISASKRIVSQPQRLDGCLTRNSKTHLLFNMAKKKYREVQELDGIRVGPATSFHAKNKYEINCEVLKIFPDGNEHTWASEPYYVKTNYGSLTYFGREHFNNSNIAPFAISDPKKLSLK